MKNKYKDILIFFLFLFLVSSVILTKELTNLDELWNYNFARNICDGLKPYKDFNIIITPLLSIICGIVLKVLGNQLIIMRIIAIFLNASILFVGYKILRKLNINVYLSTISLIALFVLLNEHFCIDYNFAILLIILIIIYIELIRTEKAQKILHFNLLQDLFLGIMVGSTILLKQTVGVVISLIFVFYKILIVYKKEDWLCVLKILISRLLGIIIPIGILLVYLFSNSIFEDFLDYTVYGISTFSNKASYVNLMKQSNVVIQVLTAFVPITIIYMYFKTVIKKQKDIQDNNLFILFAYSIGSFIITFPIADEIHFLIGSVPSIISLIYIIYNKTRKIVINKKIARFSKLIINIAVILLISIAINKLFIYFTRTTFSKLNHFKFIPSSMDDMVVEVDNYIIEQERLGYKVYILDATASLYMIPLNKYNKNYDMFNRGNLGAKGENGQIESLEKENNTKVLLLNDKYRKNWQNPQQVTQYIKDEWNKVEEIGKFDTYIKERI